MEKLIEILNTSGHNVTEASLTEWVQSKGKDPANLQNGDIAKLSREYADESSGAIQVSQPSKPTKGKRGGQRVKAQSFDSAMARSAAEVEQVFSKIEAKGNSAIDGYVTHRASLTSLGFRERLNDAPAAFVQAITDDLNTNAEGYRADADAFCGELEAAIGRAFATVGSVPAESLDSQS